MAHTGGVTADLAARVGALIDDLDTWIQALRIYVPPIKPWQRALLRVVDEADGRMQILRMTIALDKPSGEIVDATLALAASCQRLSASIRGSRGDTLIRQGAVSIASLSQGLRGLMTRAAGLVGPRS